MARGGRIYTCIGRNPFDPQRSIHLTVGVKLKGERRRFPLDVGKRNNINIIVAA
jgi:hypothetical protein